MTRVGVLPVGVVTMLFTDIEGSTLLLDRLGDRYAELLGGHHHLMREAIAATNGCEVDTAGDSFFVAFSSARDALDCALRAQHALGAQEWPGGESVRVRMGIHVGTPAVSDDTYVGMDVHRAARVMAVAHGGQVLVTESARDRLESSVELLDLGHHRLKDLPAPEHLCQLVAVGLPGDFPPLRSLNRSNLPAAAHALVGRRAELAGALRLLERGDVRLLTLLGPGGSGKSRLAWEVAAESVTRYRDGVWFVALAPLSDPGLVVSEVARVLGVEEAEGEPLARTLAREVGQRELLLFLDNFEHLMGAAGLVSELLEAAPRLDVLVTSREALRLRGEHRVEVGPLPLADAVELFVARAREIRTDLIDDEDREAVRRICLRLEGLPLALELAAARVALFGVRALEGRLAQRLALPAGARDLPDRQRTLRATIDWSYRLLPAEEQALFRGLAAFAGGARLEAIETVFAGGQLEPMEGIAALLDKSLLRSRQDPDGDPRFWMLETIREYAAECAEESGDADVVASRLAEYLTALAGEAAARIPGPDEIEWLDLLAREHDNLRASLGFLERADPERALRLTASLWEFWATRGFLSEGRACLSRALDSTEPGSPEWHAAMHGASFLAFLQGDHPSAAALARDHLDVARRVGNGWGELRALGDLANAVEEAGRRDEARTLFAEFLALAEREGDERARGSALASLGSLAAELGDSGEARELLEQAADVFRQLGQRGNLAATLVSLGGNELRFGETVAAVPWVREALELGLALRDEIILAASLLMVAAIVCGDDAARAARLLGAADALIERASYELETGENQLRRETLDQLVPALSRERLADEQGQGRALPPEDAVELALGSLR